MRKLPLISGVFVAAAILVAACGGSTTPTVPAVVVPTLPAINLPTLPPVNLPTLPVSIPTLPSGSFALPSFAIPSFAIPSFAGDPDLAAKFPKTIGGATVGPVQTALYAELFAAIGGSEQSQAFAAAMTSIGVNPNTVSYGDATVMLSNLESITAIRTPGFSADQFMASLPQISAMLQPDQPAPVVGQISIAGKTITTLTDSNETVTYFYPSGDTIWTTGATDPADLTAIFTAIQ